jgi:ring-1,2-phenylacetyl-CoA epoxidase subunit PaaB
MSSGGGTRERSERGRSVSDCCVPPTPGRFNYWQVVGGGSMSTELKEWPLWEVFVRSKQGLEHKHCGSLHAADAAQALDMARDVYTRRQEGVSIWVVESKAITASNPDDKGALFDPAADKIYRHPTFYEIPDEVGHM